MRGSTRDDWEIARRFRDNDDDESGMDQNTLIIATSAFECDESRRKQNNLRGLKWNCRAWVCWCHRDNPKIENSIEARVHSEISKIICNRFCWLEICFSPSDACNSRTVPRPRTTPAPQAPTTTPRPNITFQTFTCPPDFATWYCLNGATCFLVKIGDGQLYNCE